MRTLLPLLMLCACGTPKVGQKCSEGDAFCLDARTSLACRSGALAKFDCGGPKGCVVDGQRSVLCDQSGGAAAGTPCFLEYEGRGQCSGDGASILQCLGGLWAQAACPQGQACHSDTLGISCQ